MGYNFLIFEDAYNLPPPSATIAYNSQDPLGTPWHDRTGPTRVFLMFFISYGTRTGTIYTTRICKNSARASYLGLRDPCGPRTGCLRYLNPCGARKLIMHALKPYGPRRGRQNYEGAAQGPVSGRKVIVQKNPGTAGSGHGSVMWQA